MITCAAVPARGQEDRRDESLASRAQAILDEAHVRGGLVVHVGCGDGRLTAALRTGDGIVVQGVDTDRQRIEQGREWLSAKELIGKVTLEYYDGRRLPYIDRMVNLLVVEDPGDVTEDEMLRVLVPNGVALVRDGNGWERIAKPRPETIDDWTHYLHDPSNNAVAHDQEVAPPGRLQWVGSPRYSRHHDRLSSLSGAVTAGGRVFYIVDEASPISILLPPRWTLVARDAFNGTILWKQPIGQWFTHLWPLKSGPAQLPRRLVADGDRVYVTLGYHAPLSALDAATGKVMRTYDGTMFTEEVLCSDGVLFALVDRREPEPVTWQQARSGYRAKFWDEQPRHIVAIQADSGNILWERETTVLPVTMAVDSQRIVFHDGQSVVALSRSDGKQLWRSEPVERAEEIRSFYAPTLVLIDDVVLFSGGETAGLQTGSWYREGKDSLTAIDARTGRRLWKAHHPPSGYRSAEDVLVVDGLVWTGETTSGRAEGLFTGRDLRTGEVKREFTPDVDIYWFHHRCYRGKATDNYLLMARAGTEFVDVRKQHWDVNHWIRGACLYGVMPANGLLYAPQHPCACYLEAKLSGFNAVAPRRPGPRATEPPVEQRLERGPAYESLASQPMVKGNPEDWPTYRHDAARTGRASTYVPAQVTPKWETPLGGRLSAPVAAEGKIFVAQIDQHTLHALDAATGRPLWHFIVGGRIDSPPTVFAGRVVFGSADGYVYCLRASDGALAWRFQAAPAQQQLNSYEQLESVWPVHGNVLLENGTLYFVAGRSMFLDGGLRLWRLDPRTGRPLSQTVLDDTEDPTGKDLHAFVSWLNMPPAKPDILSSDGKLIYMRSQPFRFDGKRLPLKPMPMGPDADQGAPEPDQFEEHAHLFSPTGLLDDTWWHRTYWMYGSTFVSGWSGYYLAGRNAPAGRILVLDDDLVYGYGRKPQYYRWTTPIEHQLFAAEKRARDRGRTAAEAPSETRVSVAKSPAINPTRHPLTIAAWAKAEKPNGVVVVRGGGVSGYALYLRGGRPVFSVRTAGKIATAAAPDQVTGKWVHLAGVLQADGRMQLYVDGKQAAQAIGPGLLQGDPHEGLDVGMDQSSTAGDYTGSFGFTGSIDEVVLYRRALTHDEVSELAGGDEPPATDDLVLRLSFDEGQAKDVSGKDNEVEVVGAKAVKGKVGEALAFIGTAAPPPEYHVVHHWTLDIPLFARGLLLSGDLLFAAGPPDVLDEEEAYRRLEDDETQQQIARQAQSIDGRDEGLMYVVSKKDGKKQYSLELTSSPVFDGLIAAEGRLYYSAVDGTVRCLSEQ